MRKIAPFVVVALLAFGIVFAVVLFKEDLRSLGQGGSVASDPKPAADARTAAAKPKPAATPERLKPHKTESATGPKDVAAAYYKAIERKRYKEAYELISAEDRVARSQQRFVREQSNPDDPAARAVADRTTTRVISAEIEGGDAKIDIEVTHPSHFALFGFMMEMGNRKKDGKKLPITVLLEMLAEKIASGDISQEISKKEILLKRDSDGWRMYWGYAKIDRANALLKEAEAASEQKDYELAIKKYDEIISMRHPSISNQIETAETEKAFNESSLKKVK